MKTAAHVLAFMLLVQAALTYGDELDGEALAEEKRCVACHDLTKNLLGPSYTAIAARHSMNRDVMVDVLAYKIVIGGGGNWGVVPMVPNEHVSLDEARAISRWILNLK